MQELKLDELKLDEVYGFWPTPFWTTWLGNLIIILGTVLALLIIIFFVIWLRKKNKSVWDVSENYLRELEKTQQNPNYASQKIFYTKSTEIFKNLISQTRTNLGPVLSTGITDESLVQYIIKKKLEAKFFDLKELFRHAQEVKFNNLKLDRQKIEVDKNNLLKIFACLKPEDFKSVK